MCKKKKKQAAVETEDKYTPEGMGSGIQLSTQLNYYNLIARFRLTSAWYGVGNVFDDLGIRSTTVDADGYTEREREALNSR